MPLFLPRQVQEVTPFVVHATFQYGGALGKQTRLREAMLWQDSPAYRSEPRLLSIQLHQLRLASAQLEALTDEQMIGGASYQHGAGAVTGVCTWSAALHPCTWPQSEAGHCSNERDVEVWQVWASPDTCGG